jgi:hypothetical protein
VLKKETVTPLCATKKKGRESRGLQAYGVKRSLARTSPRNGEALANLWSIAAQACWLPSPAGLWVHERSFQPPRIQPIIPPRLNLRAYRRHRPVHTRNRTRTGPRARTSARTCDCSVIRLFLLFGVGVTDSRGGSSLRQKGKSVLAQPEHTLLQLINHQPLSQIQRRATTNHAHAQGRLSGR